MLPVKLGESDPYRFRVAPAGAVSAGGAGGSARIRPPLLAIPGLGRKVAERIEAAAHDSAFTSIEDLAARTGLSRPIAERLRKDGGLEGLAESNQIGLF